MMENVEAGIAGRNPDLREKMVMGNVAASKAGVMENGKREMENVETSKAGVMENGKREMENVERSEFQLCGRRC